jgi:hypothetical protein
LDPWCQQYNYYDHLISCFLLWCLFNSHGPKTLWLLLTPSQGSGISTNYSERMNIIVPACISYLLLQNMCYLRATQLAYPPLQSYRIKAYPQQSYRLLENLSFLLNFSGIHYYQSYLSVGFYHCSI